MTSAQLMMPRHSPVKTSKNFWHLFNHRIRKTKGTQNVTTKTNKNANQQSLFKILSAVRVLQRKYRVLGWLLSSFLFATGLLDFEDTPSTRHGRLGEAILAKLPCRQMSVLRSSCDDYPDEAFTA